MKTLQEIQAEILRWSVENFGANVSKDKEAAHYCSALGSLPALLGMMEELGELSAVVLKRIQGRGYEGTDEARAAREDALADCLVFMCDFAARERIDLNVVLDQVWQKVQQRKQPTWADDKARETLEDVKERWFKATGVKVKPQDDRSTEGKALLAQIEKDILQVRDTLMQEDRDSDSRTVADIEELRRGVMGCCEDYANNLGCDCMARAMARESGKSGDPNTPPGDRSES